VNNTRFNSFDSINQFVKISCTVLWDNSWRNATNYDAAWIFVKYRENKGAWKHATLSSTPADHVMPINAQVVCPNDGKGVFLQQNTIASNGNVSFDIQLSWNYGVDGVSNSSGVDVQVFAVEMVYVPQGSFTAGNGSVAAGNSFRMGGISTQSYPITSEAGIAVDDQVASQAVLNAGYPNTLWASGFSGNLSTDAFDTIPATFPKGFKAFYCMKHELTQKAYVDFLNTLTYAQQEARTATSPSSTAGTGALSSINANRNGIDIMTPGINPTKPAVYANNLTANTLYNQSNDGEYIACNFLSWADLAAYLDWSALRPMTEFEFEKACRGTLSPVNYEYAWGSTLLSNAIYSAGDGLENPGSINEGIRTQNYLNNLGNAVLSSNNNLINGPLRVGIFAAHINNNNSRLLTGATYYGIMEMSGNILERCVTIFNKPIGRQFTGTHGDGHLTITGDANPNSWPSTNGNGIGLRGGSFANSYSAAYVSSRALVATSNTNRNNNFGGRGVRTAP
jgi:formylglycine-generating enzyme required for sulfatase activity